MRVDNVDMETPPMCMDTGKGHVKATMGALFEELREVMLHEDDGGISLAPTLELTSYVTVTVTVPVSDVWYHDLHERSGECFDVADMAKLFRFLQLTPEGVTAGMKARVMVTVRVPIPNTLSLHLPLN
jgi:hypothetical protein